MKIIWCIVPGIWSVTEITFSHFRPFFALLLNWKTPKNKVLKKWNKNLEISSFYTRVQQIMIIYYTVPKIWPMMDIIFIFYFELLFAFLKHLEISPLYPFVPKIRITWCMVLEILAWRTDRWMNREVTYKGGCPALLFNKNIWIF